MGKRRYRDIQLDGVVYADADALAAAKGVKPATARRAIRLKRLHRLGVGRPGPEPMPVRIGDREFADVPSAAKALGKTQAAVWSAISDGDPDRLVRPPRWNPAKAQPIEIGGLHFPSHRAASRALGFSNPDYVGVVLRRGYKRGWQRVLGAAMALRARLDAAAQKAEAEHQKVG